MSNPAETEARLESWKAIAAYLNRDIRTVRRWEASEGLPVHRHHHLARSTVYAFPSELEAWRAARRPEPVAVVEPTSRAVRVSAVAAIAMLSLAVAGHGSMRAAIKAQVQLGQTVRAIWTGEGVDAMGSPSADGRYLSFTDWTTGDLAVRDLVEGTTRRLTNTGGWEQAGDFAEYSLLSPDGRRVAYAWFVDRGDTGTTTCRCRYELRVMDVGGPAAATPSVLMTVDDPAFWVRPIGWLPDGASIVVARTVTQGRDEIGSVSLTDGAYRLIRAGAGRLGDRLSVSPDGRRIAMSVIGGDTGSDIALVDVASGRTAPLVAHPANDSAPVFTPDGSQVLFISDRTGSPAVWRVPVSGDALASAPVLVSPVPDGAGLLGGIENGALYYFTGGASSNIFVADVDAAAARRSEPAIAVERFTNANTMPVFSPDGRQLAYYSRRGAAAGSARQALMIHTLATRQDREVPVSIQPNDGLSWFPDGRALLVTVRDPGRPGYEFHRVEIATGVSRLLVRPNAVRAGLGVTVRRPVVTPDGRAIIFGDHPEGVVPKGAGSIVLRRYDLQSRRLTDVVRTPTPQDDITSFAISPDGSEIAFLRFDPTKRDSVLEVSRMDGRPARELFRERNTGATRFSGLAWTRDRRYILMARSVEGRADGSLWRVPVGGGAAEPTGITMPGPIRFPSVSPDGSRVAFAVAGHAEPAIWTLEHFLPTR